MNTFIAMLAALFIAHALGDFVLQRKSMILAKQDRRPLAYLEHGCWHLAALVLAWWLFVSQPWWQPKVLLAFGVIVLSHLVIDFIKESTRPGGGPWRGPLPFVLDQGAHLLILVGLALWLGGSARLGSMLTYGWQLYAPLIAIVLGGYLFVVFGAGYLNAVLLPRMVVMPSNEPNRSHSEAHSGSDPRLGMINAGLYIGWLERFLLLTAVLLQSPAALGLTLAAKSIFRFDDIRQGRASTEYFLIGTLLSLSQAVAGGLLIHWLLAVLG